MSDDIVITGMGIVSPIGVGESDFWDALRAGRSGAAPIDCLDTSDLSRRIGCQVKNWSDEATERRSDEGSGRRGSSDEATERQSDEGSRSGGSDDEATPPRRERIDHETDRPVGRAARLAMVAARQATAAAGFADAPGHIDPSRTSVIVGTTMGETEFIEDRLSAGADEWLSPVHVQSILAGKPGSIAGHVADALFARPDHSVAVSDPHRSARADQSSNHLITKSRTAVDLYGACAAGNMAIESARRQLRSGRCDLAIAGGADGFSRLAFIGFMRLRVMAAEVCRPFDVARDGLFVGEGSAMFVLERESSAKARGAAGRILGRVLGAGNAGEDYHPTRPHPEGDGLSRAIAAAMNDAGLTAADIDYICAHGTGTPQNDAIEVGVMNRMFAAGTPFSSIKALTGHCMGAAAAIEAAACLLMLRHQTLIPTWNLANVLQPCALDAVAGGPLPARLRTMINNSAGFGGYNSSVILSR